MSFGVLFIKVSKSSSEIVKMFPKTLLDSGQGVKYPQGFICKIRPTKQSFGVKKGL